MLLLIIAVIFAYLIGSINFAVIFSKVFMKKDVREVGSGNAGATNVLRSAGVLPGILTFLCDALKGFVAAFGGMLVFEYFFKSWSFDFYAPVVGAYLCGAACMLGHVFPVFFKFKGGKGVATSVGIYAVCCPIAIVAGLTVFALIAFSTRYVSLASVLAAVVVVGFSLIFPTTDTAFVYQTVFSLIMGVIVVVKHKDNIKRLINGTENKIGGKRNG